MNEAGSAWYTTCFQWWVGLQYVDYGANQIEQSNKSNALSNRPEGIADSGARTMEVKSWLLVRI